MVVYCKGSINGNADALSHLPTTTPTPVAMTAGTPYITDTQQAQRNDSVLQQLIMHYHILKINQPILRRTSYFEKVYANLASAFNS